MGKLVALNTNNEEKKLKTEQPIATTVAQGLSLIHISEPTRPY